MMDVLVVAVVAVVAESVVIVVPWVGEGKRGVNLECWV